MPTWQRWGPAVPPRRPGQGRSPQGRWSLGPRLRVRQAVAEQSAAGRGAGSLGGQKGSSLRREGASRTDQPICGSGGWEEDVCFGGGEETILRVMGRSLLQMGSRDHSELEAGISFWGG